MLNGKQIRIPLGQAALRQGVVAYGKLTPDQARIDPERMPHVKMIVRRGVDMARRAGVDVNPDMALMDMALCDKLFCPLNLTQLWLTSDNEFAADFFGILQNWDREKFVLKNEFKPRYAKAGR